MFYDDPDMMYDEYRIAKYEEEQLQEEEKEMLTVNYTRENNDNVNNNNTNEVNEMSENKKVAVVFVSAKGKMSKPMMAVEDVAAAVGTYWRDLYSKEDFPKNKTSKKGARRLQTKTIKNPSHVKELGVASGKLAPRVTYNKIYNIRGWNSEHHRKTKALFEAAEVKYYDEANKRILTYAEAMAKNKVNTAKTLIEIEVDVHKPVADKPVSLFSLDGLDDGLGDIASLPENDIEVENKKRELTEERNALQTLVEQTIEITQKSHRLLSDLLAKRGEIEVQIYDLERNEN